MQNGFSGGKFAAADCDIATGSFPAAANFSVTDFNIVDQNSAPIPGLTVSYTAAIQ
jgi:hypothetical protein